MRDQNRGEDTRGTRSDREPAGDPRPLDSRYFVSRDELAKVFAGAPHIDFKRFREDIDAYIDQDPTPRFWRES